MGSKLRVEPLFYLTVAAAVLLIPFRWLAAWALAVCVHELSHILMLKILYCDIRGANVSHTGVVIETETMSPWKELLCAVAGPAGSFSLLLLSRWMPLVAVCGFFQGCYNLLPLHPMDGGRAVHCLLIGFFREERARVVQSVLEWVISIGLLILGLYCMVHLSLGPLPLLFALLLVIRSGKIPCKTWDKRVQ